MQKFLFQKAAAIFIVEVPSLGDMQMKNTFTYLLEIILMKNDAENNFLRLLEINLSEKKNIYISGLQKIIPKLFDLIVLRNSLILPLWSPHLGD